MEPSQVSAAQWQSFEMRMRQRRATRLVIRAQAALEQGLVTDAAAALDEARGLDSSTPDLETLMATLPSPAAVDVPLVTETLLLETETLPLETETPVEESIVTTTGRRTPGWIAVAAALALIGSGLVAWGVVRLSPRLTPPTTSTAASSVPAAIPEQPIAATTGRADTPVAPAAASSSPAADNMREVEAPAPKDPAANRADVVEATGHDTEPPVVPASRPVTPPPPLPSVAPSTPETPHTEPEPVRDLPATERVTVALPEAAPAPPPPVAAAPPDVSVPSPVVAPPVAPAPAEAPRVDDAPLVRRVLAQYESAYSSLDVSAAKRVWPSVDTFALARAFDGLAMQRISLGECHVLLNGPTARADCRGSAQWTPKIGGGTRSGSRSWAFNLRKTDGQWRIVDATAR